MAPKFTEGVEQDQGNIGAQKRSKAKLALTVAVAVGVGVVTLASSAGNAYADGGTDSGPSGPPPGQCPNGSCGAPGQDGGGCGCGAPSGPPPGQCPSGSCGAPGQDGGGCGCGWALVFGITPVG
jgi:hypothetical protein